MQGLVDYGSNRSLSEEEDEERDSYPCPNNKKLKQVDDQVIDPKFKTNLMAKLLKLGCSFDEVVHATSVCGENGSLEDIFDFIQAERYQSRCADTVTPYSNSMGKNFGNGSSEMREINGPESSDKCSGINGITNNTNIVHSSTEIEENTWQNVVSRIWWCHNQIDGLQVGNRDENSYSKPLEKLKRMGFLPDEIQRASEDCSSIDFDVLLEYLLDTNKDDSGYETDYSDDADDDHYDKITSTLEVMGFSVDAIRSAIATYGTVDIEVLLCILTGDKESRLLKSPGDQPKDSHYDASLLNSGDPRCSRNHSGILHWTHHDECKWYSYIGKRKFYLQQLENFSQKPVEDDSLDESLKKGCENLNEEISPSIPLDKMMGFGIPGYRLHRPHEIPSIMQGPPYFYFENVASVPRLEWQTIERHFHGIIAEFTDSKYFSACKRARGYVHNLSVAKRKLILPPPPKTIFEAFPYVKKYWPPWDTRDIFNCISTRYANDTLCGLIRDIFTEYEGSEIPEFRQKEILLAVKKWNLVWVGHGQVARLEPYEVEMLLGYDRDHTRGCSGISDRYDLLGNSFQVDTVAYHLSPLKVLYPDGITVLSLFSGIGGAEVSLHKLGIQLKCVIAVEINEKARNVLTSWWEKTGQRGELLFQNDVRDLTADTLKVLIDRVGKIDLVIGGSPCNNLSGNNRVSRVGLKGKESSLFFEFPRIFNIVKEAMDARNYA